MRLRGVASRRRWPVSETAGRLEDREAQDHDATHHSADGANGRHLIWHPLRKGFDEEPKPADDPREAQSSHEYQAPELPEASRG